LIKSSIHRHIGDIIHPLDRPLPQNNGLNSLHRFLEWLEVNVHHILIVFDDQAELLHLLLVLTQAAIHALFLEQILEVHVPVEIDVGWCQIVIY
jgi:hypothetical protein